MKKVLSLVLILLLSMGILAGCGGNESKQTEQSKQGNRV
jgi:uncharacterized lipoprotein YehR (DUF1307 family)